MFLGSTHLLWFTFTNIIWLCYICYALIDHPTSTPKRPPPYESNTFSHTKYKPKANTAPPLPGNLSDLAHLKGDRAWGAPVGVDLPCERHQDRHAFDMLDMIEFGVLSLNLPP